jgi:hypothetical protein
MIRPGRSDCVSVRSWEVKLALSSLTTHFRRWRVTAMEYQKIELFSPLAHARLCL